jgi:hypothetical protein
MASSVQKVGKPRELARQRGNMKVSVEIQQQIAMATAAASAIMIVEHNDGKISISWCLATNKQAVMHHQRYLLMLLQHDTIM